jgi:hypothetical protein
VEGLFPRDGRVAVDQKVVAEESIQTVFIMQFMEGWTFDTERLSKCSCQHLLPGNRRVPSCGYYAYHRQRGLTLRVTPGDEISSIVRQAGAAHTSQRLSIRSRVSSGSFVGLYSWEINPW